jgi:hypothetical protein
MIGKIRAIKSLGKSSQNSCQTKKILKSTPNLTVQNLIHQASIKTLKILIFHVTSLGEKVMKFDHLKSSPKTSPFLENFFQKLCLHLHQVAQR